MKNCPYFRYILFCIVLMTFQGATYAQAPAIEWQRSFGGTSEDVGFGICATRDSGYIVSGACSSGDGDITGFHGVQDYWVVKLSGSGVMQWQKALGGNGYSFATAIRQTFDGGYIMTGYTEANSGDATSNYGGKDYWVVKLSSAGILEWQKSLGGSGNDFSNDIQQTSDSGYIVIGNSQSDDYDVTWHHGTASNEDVWVVKLSPTGNIIWERSLGGSGGEEAFSVQQTSDGGYIFAAYTESTDGDVTAHLGGLDIWIVKLTPTGHISWQKSFGGTGDEIPSVIKQTADGGYVVAGHTSSTDGDVTLSHGNTDYWILKLNATGSLIWQRTYGSSGADEANSIVETADGGFIVAGSTTGNNDDVAGSHGAYEDWVIKLSSAGTIIWQKTLGGSSTDIAYGIAPAPDGGFTLAGQSNSTNGDVSGNHGFNDFWVVKLAAPSGLTDMPAATQTLITPNPTSGTIYITNANSTNVVVYNMSGQLILQRHHAENISLHEYPTGMYTIMLLDDDKRVINTSKICKE